MQLVAMQRTVEQTEALIRDINTSGVAELGLLPLDQITGTTILERLEAGENVSLEDSEGHRYLYQKLSGEPWVLVVEQTEPHSLWLERLLAVLLYTALAIAVGFWLWPLSREDRKSTRLNSSHVAISYAVFCLKKKRSYIK